MLIIVESPAKAKTISKIVGSKYTVKASVGHIRRISESKKTPDNRTLEINGIDIDQNFTPIYEVDPDKKKVVAELKKLAKNEDVILFATDADREGEAISWHLSEILGIKDKSKVKRLEFHEITKKAIDEAIREPRILNVQLVQAQQARQVLDKLVGYKLSPVLWKTMNNYRLSAGRVQSPALRLICEREKEIQAFIPKEFWTIDGIFDNQQITKSSEYWHSNQEDKDVLKNEKRLILNPVNLNGTKIPKIISSKNELNSLINGLSDHPHFTINRNDIKEEKSYTKPPFTTSTLQQAASSKLGLGPKLTMQLAQKLYEGVELDGTPTALITYMRTDSVNLSQESVEAARTYIQNNFKEYLPSKQKNYKSKSKNSQEAHEAIRPVNPLITPASLIGKIDSRLHKLYELIWKQMIASQMTDEIRTRVSISAINDKKDEFSGSFAWTIHPGYKALTSTNLITKPIFHFEKGEKLYLQDIHYNQKFTLPPSRYSAASLIKKLEELGIGRPSTYASIISTLIDRDYVENKTNQMMPTSLGMRISDLLSDNFSDVTSQEMTASMEENLDEISRGEKDYYSVLKDFWSQFREKVESKEKEIVSSKSKYTSTQTDVADPKYGNLMVLKVGRFGEYYQNPEHPEVMYPKNFRELAIAESEAKEKFQSQTEEKKCEECGKLLIVRVSKSTLNPYIACPDYQVGSKHTVMPVNFGPCPQCEKEGRIEQKQGVLIKKSYKGRQYLACNLDKKVCGYTEKIKNT